MSGLLSLLTIAPRPKAVPKAATVIDRRPYLELVKKAKAVEPSTMPVDILRAPLYGALEALNLGVYDYDKVMRYLTKVAPRNASIVWLAAGKGMHERYRTYTKAIPADALRLMKEVNDRVPEPLDWFVNDYEEPRPDPFLAVAVRSDAVQSPDFFDRIGAGSRVDGRDRVAATRPTFSIIYHWDEPGFGRV